MSRPVLGPMCVCGGGGGGGGEGGGSVIGLSECAWLILVPERPINFDTSRAKPNVLVIDASV